MTFSNNLIFCFNVRFFVISRLTAFVMKTFCKAQKFAGVNIDENMVCASVSWMIQNQRGDGAIPGFSPLVYRRHFVVRNAVSFSGAVVCVTDVEAFSLQKCHELPESNKCNGVFIADCFSKVVPKITAMEVPSVCDFITSDINISVRFP